MTGGLVVGLVAAGGEGNTIVDVIFSTESLSTEDEVTANKAG